MRSILLIFVSAITLSICTAAQSDDCDVSESVLRDMRPPASAEFIEARFSQSDYTCAIYATRIQAASIAELAGTEGVNARFALREMALEISRNASYPSEKRLALVQAATISTAGGIASSMQAERQADVTMIFAAAKQFKEQGDIPRWLDALILAIQFDRELPDDARRVPLWETTTLIPDSTQIRKYVSQLVTIAEITRGDKALERFRCHFAAHTISNLSAWREGDNRETILERCTQMLRLTEAMSDVKTCHGLLPEWRWKHIMSVGMAYHRLGMTEEGKKHVDHAIEMVRSIQKPDYRLAQYRFVVSQLLQYDPKVRLSLTREMMQLANSLDTPMAKEVREHYRGVLQKLEDEAAKEGHEQRRGPSFDCTKATSEVEKIICSDDELSRLDDSLSKAYQKALNTRIKDQIIESQRQWMKTVRYECKNAECLKKAYETRIKELGLSSYGIVIFTPPRESKSPSRTPEKTSESQVIESPDEAVQTKTNVNDMPVVHESGNLTIGGAVSVFAGTKGLIGSEDGVGPRSKFNHPFGITTDGTNLYVSETANHTIRKIEIATGKVSTLAGSSGKQGSADGVGKAARFQFPYGMATDSVNLYVADHMNATIRKVVIATGKVTTLAGTAGKRGFVDDNGTAARFSTPHDITILGKNLYVTDSSNNTVRRIDASTGDVTTFSGKAGTSGFTDGKGSAARFSMPEGITTDGSNLYVADSFNNIIRKIVIATREVTTFAGPDNDTCGLHRRCPTGPDDGLGRFARLNSPCFITTDGTNLYFTERHRVVRKVVIATGEVTTLSGTASRPGSTAAIMGITNDGESLYVTDVGGHAILKIQ
ncbi:MAG: DUF1311 domain-containing protein [Desulfomonile tiedjei]|uniref:DUF1311 domain-containing protein n=1 Tax=Desulfomonile tiedjei TaxID=2358 RepID=A0A9D6V5G7_9BACT|nr:DUF1311 domain-containing protein [Desulfomonile tiedjei]